MDVANSDGMVPCTVLVVDDSELVRRTLRRALAAQYVVTTAASSYEAMAFSDHYDAAIVDLDLGTSCGEVLARALLANQMTHNVIFFSGGGPDARMARARSLGPVVGKHELPELLNLLRMRTAREATANERVAL